MFAVARTKDTDKELRARIRRWLLWLRRTRYQDRTDADLAKALGISPTTLAPILNGKRSPGLDVFARLHFKGGIPADLLLDSDPPTLK
jgi:transcriptional regulator with XRE-family HTH domain